jgi:hypothetical protein
MTVEKPRKTKGETKCPLWKKDVYYVCHTCEFYTLVRGKHPQTGEVFDNWGCALALLPIIGIENSQMQRQTGAALESFRNTFAEAADAMLEVAENRRIGNVVETGRIVDEAARSGERGVRNTKQK